VAKRGSIDQTAVLDAALRVAERVGLDGLTMRMVADELGVSPMAAYRHVADRDTLVSLVADRLASTIEVPGADSGPWDQRLRVLERGAFRAGIAVPGQSDTTVVTWGPNHRRIVDGMISILEDAGFDDEEVAVAFELIWAFFLGQVRIHDHLVARQEGQAEGSTHNAYPVLGRIVRRAPNVSPEDYFDRGFDILIEGLRGRLAAKAAGNGHTTAKRAKPAKPAS
jgi:TetR/AcrR family transcriptional regulator, tetracycline repressor protein